MSETPGHDMPMDEDAFSAMVLRYLDDLTSSEEDRQLKRALAGYGDRRALFV